MFIRRRENFICEHCGANVKGNGYTNHCPECLYSKHVDRDPGDRLETCHGLMPPVAVEMARGESLLVHECELCGYRKRNALSPDDVKNRVYEVASDGYRVSPARARNRLRARRKT